jgi:hypothetical protein
MSLNTGNAILSNAITVDSSYNVGIGGSPSGSYKFEVTGTSKVSGAATFSSTLNASGVGTFTTATTVPLVAETTGGNSGLMIKTSSSTTNWLLGGQYNVVNGFEITPSTAAGGTTFSTPALVVKNTGYVGIGTSSPSYTLDVQVNNTTFTSRIRNLNTTTDNAGLLVQAGVNAGNEIALFKNASGTARMGIYANGNVGIGTESPAGKLEVSADQSANNQHINITGTQTSYNQSYSIGIPTSSKDLRFYDLTAGAERMRITSGGFLKVSNTGDYIGSTSAYHEFLSTTNGFDTIGITHRGSNPYGISLYFNNTAPNNTTNYFLLCYDTSNTKAFIYSNGSMYNRTGTYGPISDVKLKENIVDATSKLDDILKLKVRNFNFIDDETKQKQIGFIAQEFEEVFPTMVDNNTGKEGDSFKAIKTSVLIPMLVKAIQEQQAQIEELKQLVATK